MPKKARWSKAPSKVNRQRRAFGRDLVAPAHLQRISSATRPKFKVVARPFLVPFAVMECVTHGVILFEADVVGRQSLAVHIHFQEKAPASAHERRSLLSKMPVFLSQVIIVEVVVLVPPQFESMPSRPGFHEPLRHPVQATAAP